jgi:hypothetical protein
VELSVSRQLNVYESIVNKTEPKYGQENAATYENDSIGFVTSNGGSSVGTEGNESVPREI